MSKLLAIMMGGGGGGTPKVLNLEAVNGASYDTNYIFTADSGSVQDAPYFITKEKIDLRNIDNKVEITLKFMPTANYSGIFGADSNQTDWVKFFGCYVNSSGELWLSHDGNYSRVVSLYPLNTWYWLKIVKNAQSSQYTAHYSTDGINYQYGTYFSLTNMDAMFMVFGLGHSTGTLYSMKGKIDFRETDIKINDQSVLWVEESNVQFKTSIYATDNAYIQTDISANADYKIKIVGNVLVDTYTDVSSNYFFGANNPDQSPSYYLTGTMAFIGYNPSTTIPGIGLRSGNNVAGYNAPYIQDISIGSSGGHISAPYHFTLSLAHTVAYDKNFRILSDWQHTDRKTNNMISIELVEIKDQNDNLIAELKPAIVNGESGMYDTIGQQFYGNANSVGSLVCE